jgi:hypothetical protein
MSFMNHLRHGRKTTHRDVEIRDGVRHDHGSHYGKGKGDESDTHIDYAHYKGTDKGYKSKSFGGAHGDYSRSHRDYEGSERHSRRHRLHEQDQHHDQHMDPRHHHEIIHGR